MVSIIATPKLAVKSCHFDLHLRFPVVSSLVVRKRRRGSALVLTRISGFAFREVRKSVCCKGWETKGQELALEGAILEFMKKSKKPNEFPTKKELVEAGRMDLVEGIVNEGGWLSLGWELDEGNEELESDVDVEDFRRVGSFQESNSFEEKDGVSCFRDRCGSLDSSSLPASPSGRAL